MKLQNQSSNLENDSTMILLKPAQLAILKALAQYKFLTSAHLEKLGVMSHRKNINDRIADLRKLIKPLVHTNRFGVYPKIGKLSDYHHLSKEGKQFLIEEMGFNETDIKAPVGTTSPFHNDYFHRTYTIDFQIALRQWAVATKVDVVFFDTYFDKVGNNRKNANLRAKTRLDLPNKKYFIPDANFMLELSDGARELYSLEIHNGRNTKKLLQQLSNHLTVLATGSINTKYAYAYAHRILIVVEYQATMDIILERIASNPKFQHVQEHFLFKPLEHVWSGEVFWKWKDMRENIVGLY